MYTSQNNARGVQTRRVYAWMVACIETELVHYYAIAHRSTDRMHALADRVLMAERFPYQYPAISVGAYEFSWFQSGRDREYPGIFMAHTQTCYFVLLHELAHAMGFGTHSPAFVECFIDLLAKYGKCSEEKLLISAGLFGVL